MFVIVIFIDKLFFISWILFSWNMRFIYSAIRRMTTIDLACKLVRKLILIDSRQNKNIVLIRLQLFVRSIAVKKMFFLSKTLPWRNHFTCSRLGWMKHVRHLKSLNQMHFVYPLFQSNLNTFLIEYHCFKIIYIIMGTIAKL